MTYKKDKLILTKDIPIDTSIKDNYEALPKSVKLTLENLDYVTRAHLQNDTAAKGDRELMDLCAIFAIDSWLYYNMPPQAKAFFVDLISHAKGIQYMHEHGVLTGGIVVAYANLRQFIIDNSERVSGAYEALNKINETYYEKDIPKKNDSLN